MNKDIIEGNWKEAKGKIRQQWANLTDDEIGHAKGTREELSGMIQKTYGYQKDRAEKEIDDFIKTNNYKDKNDL